MHYPKCFTCDNYLGMYKRLYMTNKNIDNYKHLRYCCKMNIITDNSNIYVNSNNYV